MIALLVGGPHDGLMVSVDKGHSWLTDDGELRLPVDEELAPRKFAIYSKVAVPVVAGVRHAKGAYKFSRYWIRPEELT